MQEEIQADEFNRGLALIPSPSDPDIKEAALEAGLTAIAVYLGVYRGRVEAYVVPDVGARNKLRIYRSSWENWRRDVEARQAKKHRRPANQRAR